MRPSTLEAVKLRCEYLENPLGIDTLHPRLSWALASAEPGQRQTAYRILVASSEEHLAASEGDLWDSGRIESDETLHIPYAGLALDSGQRCWWQVHVWDKDGKPGKPSVIAWWEMALLELSDWRAKWIAGNDSSPLFRCQFRVMRPICAARLYICGLGVYEAFLNGCPVGDQPLAPQLSFFPRRVLYDTYDVADQLREGDNALGVWLAPGWFGDEKTRKELRFEYQAAHALIAQLCVEYRDGARDVVATDGTWKTAASGLTPVLSHWAFCFGCSGETLDGLSQPTDWAVHGFDDAGWEDAREHQPPSDLLRARPLQPNRVVETIEPVGQTSLAVSGEDPTMLVESALDAGRRNWGTSATNAYLRERWMAWMGDRFACPEVPLREAVEFDFGRHVSGWVELVVTGEPGDWVSLFGMDWYRLQGKPDETIRLHFVHRAFRYVPVYLYGRETAPRIELVRALGIQNDIPVAGHFSSSDPVLNQIHDAAARTWRSLMLSGMPMDSWQERFGTMLPQCHGASLYWQALGAFYGKWLDDLVDAQRSDGYIPTTGGPIAQDYWSAAWGQAGPLLIPWLMWHFYGDREIMRRAYPVVRKWLAFAEPPQNDLDKTWKPPAEHGESELCIGDHLRSVARWYDPHWGDLIETLFIIHFFQIAQELALLLGEQADADRYAGFVKRLTAKVNRPEFLDAVQARYAEGDQGCHAAALWTGVVPEELRYRVETELFRDIVETRQGHVNTGFYGTWFLLKLLDELNRPEVAYQIITADDAPSWKTLLHHPDSPEPLTVLPEFFAGGMISHPGWCSVGLWFYESLAGIHPDPAEPGFKRILIRPRIVPGLAWVEVEYDSVRGLIRSGWEQDSEQIVLSVTVPPNTTAVVEIPAGDRRLVREMEHIAGIRTVESVDGHVVYQVEPGTYRFEISTQVTT